MILTRQFLLCFLIVGICGCSTTSTTQSAYRLIARPNWAQETTLKPYYIAKLVHSMEPVLYDDVIYQGNANDGLVAVSRWSGHIRWRLNVKNGVTSGALVHNGILYFGANDGQFYAVDANNGQIIWTFPIQTESFSKPVTDGKAIFFLSGNGTLYSLDLKTGKQLWSYIQKDTSAINIFGASSPVLDERFLYIGFSDGTLACFDKDKGALKWERNLSNPQDRFHDINASPVVSGENIYVSNYGGGLFCLKKISGDIIWKVDEGGATGLTIYGSRIYYSTTNQKVLALDKQTGKQLWSYKIKNGVGSKPSFYKEMVLVGDSDGPLEILSATDGHLIKQYTTGWGISAPILVNEATNDIYIMSNYGNLYSLKLSWVRPQMEWPWQHSLESTGTFIQ